MTEIPRVAIVTGAAGGIGRAMVRGLLAAGIRVAGVDRDRQPLDALATSAREQGKADDLLTIQTDLTNDPAVDEITNATLDRFGRVDILVNNAGIGPGSIRPDSGTAHSNSGRSRLISGASLLPCTRRLRWRSRMPSCPR